MTQITPLSPADHADWKRLWTAYLDFYETEVSAEVYDTTFARLMSDVPYEPIGFIARLADGKAAGLVHVIEHRHCWRTQNVLYLQDLYVAPEARGTGLGRALIETVYDHADQTGAGTVYWTTAEDNATARLLYDRVAAKTQFIQYKRQS